MRFVTAMNIATSHLRIIRIHAFNAIHVGLGLFGPGEEMGMEIVHDHIREQRRSGEAARAVESQERRALRVPDHYSTAGLRQRLQVNVVELPSRCCVVFNCARGSDAKYSREQSYLRSFVTSS